MVVRSSRVLVMAGSFLTRPVTLALTLALALAGPFILRSEAQTNQPIYPVYDGFVKNPDGTLTLSFAYFSHNFEPVTVPVGPDNSLTPAPADRGQPRTFLPGHHRFQCIMVVGPDFDGDLRWTLAYAGTSTSTSEQMLQYNWEMDGFASPQVTRDIDPAAAPRDVCLNRPPQVRLLGLSGGPGGEPPAVSVALREPLQLFGSVQDEGLPLGATLVSRWRQISGPGTTTFSDPNQPRTRASFSAPGTYELELWVSDSAFESSTQVSVTVTEAPARR